jgi:hypothetical protein
VIASCGFMNYAIKTLIALCSCVIGEASAAVFEHDWKTPADGLLTYDDVSQREWLDVTQSILEQFPGVTLEEKFQQAIVEIRPGGRFEGFRLPVVNDVLSLAGSAGINTTTSDFATNSVAVSRLIQLLGPTLGSPPGYARTQGVLNSFAVHPPGIPFRGAMLLEYDPPSRARFDPSTINDLRPEYTGIMLYRIVPEPSVGAMLFGAAAILSIACRRLSAPFRGDKSIFVAGSRSWPIVKTASAAHGLMRFGPISRK